LRRYKSARNQQLQAESKTRLIGTRTPRDSAAFQNALGAGRWSLNVVSPSAGAFEAEL
jgi:hypothetical protein